MNHIIFLWINIRIYFTVKKVHTFMEKLASSFLDMLLVSFVEWIQVTSTYSYVLNKFIPLSSHAWSIIYDEI